MSEIVEKVALDVEKEMKKSILTGEKSGELYNSGNKLHRASAPGQAPASDTGHLANSIRHKKIDDSNHEVSIEANYATILEFGGSRIQARPFARPAVLKVKKRIQALIYRLKKKHGL